MTHAKWPPLVLSVLGFQHFSLVISDFLYACLQSISILSAFFSPYPLGLFAAESDSSLPSPGLCKEQGRELCQKLRDNVVSQGPEKKPWKGKGGRQIHSSTLKSSSHLCFLNTSSVDFLFFFIRFAYHTTRSWSLTNDDLKLLKNSIKIWNRSQ